MNSLIACAVIGLTIALASAAGQAQDVKHSLHAPAITSKAPARGYLVANYTICDQEMFQKYMDAAGPLAPKYNAKVLVFDVSARKLEGSPQTVMVIAEFPSLANAEASTPRPNTRPSKGCAWHRQKVRWC